MAAMDVSSKAGDSHSVSECHITVLGISLAAAGAPPHIQPLKIKDDSCE